MANEFKHASAGTELTQAEYEVIGAHIADGQTRGDILYFNGTSWIRLAIGTVGQVLTVVNIGAGILEPRWA